jgi:squalene cyclase
MRQRSIILACVLAVASAHPTRANDQEPPASSTNVDDAAVQRAIDRGIDFLLSTQNDEGAFSTPPYRRHVGITGLGCLALMSNGSTPGRGPHGEAVERGLSFVTNHSAETGLLASETSYGPMYGHGFATLFLGEIYGMTADGRLRERGVDWEGRTRDALERAVALIVQSQNDEGGWRYNPTPHDADISVTICQIMALRSARNAGIDVPAETIDRAVAYVKSCQNPDGGFRYQLTTGPSAWPRSAAGVASLFYAGVYGDESIRDGLDYLLANAQPGDASVLQTHYYYGHYYAVQAMHLAGDRYWEEWWPAIRDDLLRRQDASGAWVDRRSGDAYATAMALIILQMPNGYLPIFER